MLVEAIVAIQAQGPRQSQMHRGIGGVVHGLLCDSSGPRGHADTLFILFERRDEDVVIKRFVLSGWRDRLPFVLPYFRDAKQGRWRAGDIAVRAEKVGAPLFDEFEAQFAEFFAAGVVKPRYVAWVNVATSGAVIFEQTDYVCGDLCSIDLEPTGGDFVMHPKHGRILMSMPPLEALQAGKPNALWFIGKEDDLKKIVMTGRVK